MAYSFSLSRLISAYVDMDHIRGEETAADKEKREDISGRKDKQKVTGALQNRGG